MLRLKVLREAHDPPLTQQALAERARVGIRTVQRAESLGEANSSTLRKFARALGVPVGAIFDDPEEAAS